MLTLDSNKYYSLEYSLLPMNKIREVSGNVVNNTLTNAITFSDSYTKARIREEMYPYIGSEYTLPLDLTGNNPMYTTVAAYCDHSLSNITLTQGRIEFTKGYKTINVSYNTPFIIKGVKIAYEGKGYEVYDPYNDWEDWDDFHMPDNYNTDTKYTLYPSWSHKKNETSLLSEIECWNNPSTGLGNYSIGDILPRKFTNYIPSSTSWKAVEGSTFDTSLTRKVTKISDYEYTINVDLLLKFNIALRVRTLDSISTGEYTMRKLLWQLNNITQYNIDIEAYTINGENITFKYTYETNDSYKYQTSLKSNELITSDTTIDNNKWDESISNILINKYKDGKFWIKTKVRGDFIIDNDLHINSQLYIKDQDNEYINRQSNKCIFEIKNIEKIYTNSEFYYNLILLEV